VPSVRAKAQSTLTDLNQYYGFTLRMHAAVLKGNPKLAVRLVTVNNAPSSNKTPAAAAATINAQANSAASSSEQLVIIVALITIVLSALITLWLARSITRPLAEITSAAERIAQGDLDVTVNANTDDEIGRLATAFGNSVDYLGEMAGAADRIADGDLAATVSFRSSQDVLGQAFVRMRDKLSATSSQWRRGAAAAATRMCPSSSAATQNVAAGQEIPATFARVVITRRQPGLRAFGLVDWNTSTGRPGPAPVSAAKHSRLD
jgi:methyl-accepting chemotaxis protein